ncbi:uncharacterized protein LAESUDRAFT_755480 [Laetiporus sulphureus 93-53]|uniref:Uncharacterized protein n=1 Tax=Laetiporus sulphureus 93-53 TaxID=1314785 RepID=A0A165GU58_9APHY|nr:uncharacterized protein LAESUDRAFT_755480 [Laetiporus sulphureus 93-53]KZT10816.1 hypothetical protein LAESUDRAFT_755480 [Laetiporus sulphureus 93-53]
MAKGEITPFPLDLSPNTRPANSSASTSNAASPNTGTAPCRPPSFSLPGPVQRLLDFGSSPVREGEKPAPTPLRSRSMTAPSSPTEQIPILTLRLSGPSFLDTVIRDMCTKEPLYIIQTMADLTQIYRLDTKAGEAGKAATIQWPPNVSMTGKGKIRSGKSVQMGSGSWREVEDFLKVGTLGAFASRKFNLPHFPHSLKWRLVPGSCYVCNTAGIKGPIAVLDAAVLSASPRLRIYETLISPDLARSQQNFAGIPFLLIDYLVATALLLTTTTQEWLDRPANAPLPGSSSRTVQKWLRILHPESYPARENDRPVQNTRPQGETPISSPTTPFSSAGSSFVRGSHHSWPASSASGGSEQITTPTTPSTQSSSSGSRRPASAEALSSTVKEPIQESERQAGPTPADVSVPNAATVPPTPSAPPQVRFRVANPEPSPSYFASTSTPMPPQPRDYTSPPPATAPSATALEYASVNPRPSTMSSHPFAYDSFPRPSSSSRTTSVRKPRRLPTPPISQDQRAITSQGQPQIPELFRAKSGPSAHRPLHTSASYAGLNAWSAAAQAEATVSGSRAPVRRSLRSMRMIPPALPPPQHVPLPVPPKLSMEYGHGDSLNGVSEAGCGRAQRDLAPAMRSLALTSSADPPRPHPLPQPPPQIEHAYSHSRGAMDGGGVHVDAGRVRASYPHVDHVTETDSVYEMPPPAYDAIDFSVRVQVPGGHGRRRGRGQ